MNLCEFQLELGGLRDVPSVTDFTLTGVRASECFEAV